MEVVHLAEEMTIRVSDDAKNVYFHDANDVKIRQKKSVFQILSLIMTAIFFPTARNLSFSFKS